MIKKYINLLFLLSIFLFFQSCNLDDFSELDTTAPTVISTNPPLNTVNVNKSITEISVTFSEPMNGGYSFCILSGYDFPSYNAADPANSLTLHWNSSMTTITAVFSVSLNANTDYGLTLNSSQYNNFTDKNGNKLIPVEWKFSTGN